MSIYDMMCGGCGHEWNFEMTIRDYPPQPDSDEWICPDCRQVCNKNDRVLSNRIGKIVYGVSKGHYGS